MLAVLVEAIPPQPLILYLDGQMPGLPLITWAGSVLPVPAAWAIVTVFVLLRMRRAATVASAAAFGMASISHPQVC